MTVTDRRRADSMSPRPKRRASPNGRSDEHHSASNKHGPRQPRTDPRSERSDSHYPEYRVQMVLSDLDYVQPTITIAFRNGARVAKIEEAVRRHLGRAISSTESIYFYADGRELAPDEAADWQSTVQYRVFPAGPAAQKQLRITYETDDSREQAIFTELEPELTRDVYAGNTVGQLRQKFSRAMGISDPNTIRIVARGGMRPGSLLGNEWEARQVNTWLCLRLAIELCDRSDYLILRGLGREYLYQPRSSQPEGAMARDVKSWLEKKLLKDVHQRCLSRIHIRSGDIQLERRGRQLRSSTILPWGTTVEFELAPSIGEVFSAEEMWLYPINRTCSVCGDDKRTPEMPVQITQKCSHEPTTCKDCLQQWIASSMEAHSWDRLKCPECPELLEFKDVQNNASRETFERYDHLATRAALTNIPNFRWCLEEGCDSGQIHDDTCPRFKCLSCKGKHCIQHEVKWHRGETCEEYDKRNKTKRKQDKASEATIKEISKKCPECKRPVSKYVGCNHITCVCGHEWCYICFGAWTREPMTGMLTCAHTATCPEKLNDPFLGDDIFWGMRMPQHQPAGFEWPRPHHGNVPRPPPPPPLQPNPFFFQGDANVPPPVPMPPLFAAREGIQARHVAAGIGLAAVAGLAAMHRRVARELERERERERAEEILIREREEPRREWHYRPHTHYRPPTPPRGGSGWGREFDL